MRTDYSTFVGIDLGGGRGKTTAVARLKVDGEQPGVVSVEEVNTRHASGEPWTDEVLLDYLASLSAPEVASRVVVAIDAPLTVPACVRCTVTACPGIEGCEVPATVWLRTQGSELQQQSLMSDRDQIAAIPSGHGFSSSSTVSHIASRKRLVPYTHRCTEVDLHYRRDLIPREHLGRGTGPIEARAGHLRRRLVPLGYELNRNLIEVSPRSTVQALFGDQKARGYKRDADPWETRASIIEGLGASLSFSPKSRLSREEVLRNDHCFEALLSGYTAYLWARDEWSMDEGPFADDGYIWAPPTT